MNTATTTVSRIAPEVAKRALDLPQCVPCGIHPLRIADSHGRFYVDCPNCPAGTHRASSQDVADMQWRFLALSCKP